MTVTALASGLVTPDLTRAAASGGGEGFGDKLQAAIDAVDQQQHVADDRLSALASGENVDLHSTMIALEEADISLRAMVTVRDRVVESYQQIFNMAI